jgi:hypothetical protein
MTDVPLSAASEAADPSAVRRATIFRLVTGLAQGLLAYGLFQAGKHRVWPATQDELFSALTLIVAFVPFVVLAGVSSLRLITLAAWKALAAAIAGGLGAYWMWSVRGAGEGTGPDGNMVALAGVGALLFIGHHLIEPADVQRRRIARYPAYFDITWKHGVQLALSVGFTGAFWLLLFLASALFKLIGVDAIEKLVREPVFYFPATAVMFAAAVQLTDVRASLVRGVRTVALALLSWLLPLMALIAGAFLLTLPFTGLEPLWRTKSATAILLTADAFLILLTNAAYQDGTETTAGMLKWAARLAGLLLVPITVLAAYGLSLRIGQYGLSPDRVIAAACVLVAAGYALGYAAAAVRPGAWMKTLETTNIAMAFVVIAVLLALFTPLADPRRLSVGDQVARLKGGKVSAEAFDYTALRFQDGRYGRETLDRLERDPNPVIRGKAAWAAAPHSFDATQTAPRDRFKKTLVYPKGQTLPPRFVYQAWKSEEEPDCLKFYMECKATLIDTDGDGAAEVLLSSGRAFEIYKADKAGVWAKTAVTSAFCGDVDKELKAGDIQVVPSLPARDLVMGGQRLRIDPVERCGTAGPATGLTKTAVQIREEP